MPTIQAKDLTKEFPRSPYDELEGFPWLPRLIDKVRALDAGQIGEYTPFPCGGDQGFIAHFGLDAGALRAKISSGATDAEVAAWVSEQVGPDQEAKKQSYRAAARQPVQPPMSDYLEGAKAELKAQRPELDLSDVDNFARLICKEEGYAY